MENVLLLSVVGSKSARTAQASTCLPPACLIGSSGRNSPSTGRPISSSNSLLAAASGSSPSENSPFGIDHAPSSFFAQNGPPGWTSSTSTPAGFTRKRRSPALCFGKIPTRSINARRWIRRQGERRPVQQLAGDATPRRAAGASSHTPSAPTRCARRAPSRRVVDRRLEHSRSSVHDRPRAP